MVDLRGMPPAYMGNMTFHRAPDPSANKTPAIEESKAASSLSGGSLSGQSRNFFDRTGSANDNSAPDTAKADRPMEKRDENTNAGPPPSFQISILELERDLSQQLARVNAEQSLARDILAVAPSPANGATRADPRATREPSVPNPMAEPSYANPMAEPSYANPMAEPSYRNPMADRASDTDRTETAQDPARQNPAAQNQLAQNQSAQNPATQNPATQGPEQPQLAEGV